MVQKTIFKMKFRRRRAGITDYSKRLAMVKCGLPRLTVRKTNKAIIAQLIIKRENGDVVLSSANSAELAHYGWLGNSNLPSAYLTGYLCGLRANGKAKRFILDMGRAHPSKSCFAFAALKGTMDSGLESNMGEGILDEARLTGKHIAGYAAKLKAESGEKYQKLFSAYLKANLKPEEIDKQFSSTKEKISQNPNPNPKPGSNVKKA